MTADLPDRLGDKTVNVLFWRSATISASSDSWTDIWVDVPQRKCKIVAKRTAQCEWQLTISDNEGNTVYYDKGTSEYSYGKFMLHAPIKRRG